MTTDKVSPSATRATIDTMDSGVSGVEYHPTKNTATSSLHRASTEEDVVVAEAARTTEGSQRHLARAATAPMTDAAIAADEPAPEGEQNRFKMVWSILKKLVGVRDIVSMRISVPAQLLEPMSNLEYWNYMDRPDYFCTMADPDDPLDRMINVVRWWYTKDLKHIHGRLVKPYNSTLGEQFICRWRVPKAAAPGDAAVDAAQLDTFTGSDSDVYT
ncbi:hypothetical protein SYNPS1DRAFT_29804, partial [Syncephalis pseudoplumigaleata]